MRIAIVDGDRCQPKKCGKECLKYCPLVRTGDEVISFVDDKPLISEELCSGCGICIKKCPFSAIQIVGLPSELKGKEIHRYGPNSFVLYGVLVPSNGVTGILGPNGTGKSTIVKILCGEITPNLGMENASWDDVLRRFSGTEAKQYLQMIRDGRVKVAYKRQELNVTDSSGIKEELAEFLEIDLSKSPEQMSGGELQRLAIAKCLSQDADIYFLDEVTPYLDIYQRMKVARKIREFGERKKVVVVEHDLAVLDLLSDVIHITYGVPSCYGVITSAKGVRSGINEYLQGFLREENVRIRDSEIRFEVKGAKDGVETPTIAMFSEFEKRYDGFVLQARGGEIREGEVIGIVGPNSIGKTTFVKVLAGVEKATKGDPGINVRISYKPQYLKPFDAKVSEVLKSSGKFGTSQYETEIMKPLQLERLLEMNLMDLSGGELQRVAIACCMGMDADLYILDEPSAHLDVEQRNMAIRVIRRCSRNGAAMVVDHDIYFIDMLSDRLLVFSGTPGVFGVAEGIFEMREGMNRFLRQLGITFRRDESGRPRVNKPDSQKDREQKRSGEYYYPREM